MNKKIRLYITAGIIGILTITFFFNCNKGSSRESNLIKQADSSKNLLLISVDTLRYDRVGIYNQDHVKTPNIDQLAKKSWVFSRAFAHNPTTLPSHTNMLTGTTPLYHGIHDNTGYRLADSHTTMAEFLKEKGYKTAAFVGAFPLDSRFGLNQGFDVYDDSYPTHNALKFYFAERKAADVLKNTLKWLQETKDSKWFTFIHFFDPHHPYDPPQPFAQEYAHDLYSGEVAYVDFILGKLFTYLQEAKLLRDTIIIFTADHGEALGDKGEDTHSYFAYNSTIHIPLIIHAPDNPKFQRINQPVSHIDLFPTICDLLGFKKPGFLQGKSLIPLAQGKIRKDYKIYFESLYAHLSWDWAPLRGMIKDNIKFINLPLKEVYDLSQDFNEEANLADQYNTGNLSLELNRLQMELSNLGVGRSNKIMTPSEKKMLESLGYVAQRSASKKKIYTKEDDLKTKLIIFQLFQKAGASYHKNNPAESLKLYEEVIKLSPSMALAYMRMATIHKDTGKMKKALSILKEGVRANPNNFLILSNLGIMLSETNNVKRAIEILEKCINEKNFDPEAYNYLGISHAKLGNYDQAMEYYRKILELDTNYAPAYNNIGSLYLMRFKKEKERFLLNQALQNFQKAILLDQSLSTAYNSTGVAYNYLKQYDKAIQHWQIALNIKPDYFDPYLNIALTYRKLGNRNEALNYLYMIKNRIFYLLSVNDQKLVLDLINQISR